MALTRTVRNVNPIGAVSAYLDDVTTEVAAGGTVSVTPETAGVEPRWRRVEVTADGEPAERIDLTHLRLRAGHVEVYDLGSGMLAQPSNWRPADDDSDPADPADDGGGHFITAWPTPEPVPADLPADTTPDEENN